jgi:sulfur dioxygenase
VDALKRSRPRQAPFREILPRIVHETHGTARIIDVREPGEFTGDLGHIASAELVPLEDLERASKRWRSDEPLILVCRSGGRAALAAEHLSAQGFVAVMNMVGGMLGWNAAALPIER